MPIRIMVILRTSARLSQQEIDTIVKWVSQGAKQGDPKDLPELPQKITDWEIGKPDYVLAMTQEYTVQAHSPDAYVYVTFPTKFKEDKWVQAAEIVPGNKRIVHHVIAHVLAAAGSDRTPRNVSAASSRKLMQILHLCFISKARFRA